VATVRSVHVQCCVSCTCALKAALVCSKHLLAVLPAVVAAFVCHNIHADVHTSPFIMYICSAQLPGTTERLEALRAEVGG
jgi:hypothetical protein